MHQLVNTTLSVKEAADAFREAGAKFISGYAKLVGGLAALNGHRTNEFFTPDLSRDPFFKIGGPPVFSIGVSRAKVGMYGARAGDQDAVHMYVFDRGQHRELQFYSPHGAFGSSAAKKRLAVFVDTIRASDPKAQVAAPE